MDRTPASGEWGRKFAPRWRQKIFRHVEHVSHKTCVVVSTQVLVLNQHKCVSFIYDKSFFLENTNLCVANTRVFKVLVILPDITPTSINMFQVERQSFNLCNGILLTNVIKELENNKWKTRRIQIIHYFHRSLVDLWQSWCCMIDLSYIWITHHLIKN